MMRKFCFLAVFLICAAALPARAQIVQPPVPQETAEKDGRIGTVIDVEGPAVLTPVGGMPAEAAVNMPVYLNDIAQTGAHARLFILFIDNTNVVLSSNAMLRIDKYVYDPDDATSADNNATYTIEGAFEYVSGLIGHRKDPDVHVETPVGSIGIRGTDFWAGPMDGQYQVAVNEGRVSLKTDGGEEIVNKGEGTYVRGMFDRPAPAEIWSADRFRRMAAEVRLARYAAALRRMHALQSRQPAFREVYRAYVRRAHPHWLRDLHPRGMEGKTGAERIRQEWNARKSEAAPGRAEKSRMEKDRTEMWRSRWRAWRQQHSHGMREQQGLPQKNQQRESLRPEDRQREKGAARRRARQTWEKDRERGAKKRRAAEGTRY